MSADLQAPRRGCSDLHKRERPGRPLGPWGRTKPQGRVQAGAGRVLSAGGTTALRVGSVLSYGQSEATAETWGLSSESSFLKNWKPG